MFQVNTRSAKIWLPLKYYALLLKPEDNIFYCTKSKSDIAITKKNVKKAAKDLLKSQTFWWEKNEKKMKKNEWVMAIFIVDYLSYSPLRKFSISVFREPRYLLGQQIT